MKRFVVIIALFLALAALTAQETQTSNALVISGSVTSGLVFNNLANNQFISSIPGLSGTTNLSNIELIISSEIFNPENQFSLYKGIFTPSSGLGFSAGIVMNVANLFDTTESASKTSFNSDTSGYPLIQRMIDWYVNNRARYGLPETPFGTTWPSTSYGASAGRYRFISGNTVEPMEWVVWDQSKWSDARALYQDVKNAIEAAIEAMTTSVTTGGGEHINQYDFRTLSTEQQALVIKEQEAHDSFASYVYGSSASFAINGVTIEKGWLSFTNIAGVLDARLDFVGANMRQGALVTSPRAVQEQSGMALTLAMRRGILPGLGLSLGSFVSGGTPSETEDWETKSMEYWAGEAAWVGFELTADYDFSFLLGQDLSLKLSARAPDLLARMDMFNALASVSYRLDGMLSVRALAEGSILTWNNRYIADDANVFTFAAGLNTTIDFMGAGIHATAKWKNTGFGGTGGNDADDLFPATSLWGDFDAAKLASALGADAGLHASTKAFLGLDIAEIRGGYRLFMYGDTYAVQGSGWYGELTARFKDLINLPISISGSIDSWTNNGLIQWTDSVAWPTPGILADISWTASLTWNPSKKIEVELVYSDSETEYKVDTQRVSSLGLYSTIRF